jgi:DNA mismatch repair protein MutS
MVKNHNILDEYLSIVNEYKNKYTKSIVLYQVGSFYELYSPYENDLELTNVCNLLNIILSKKNKSIAKISLSNPHMAGIPCCALEKYLDILINKYYTVIVYNQYEEKNKIKRKLDKIYSISTYIDSEKIIQDDNLIMSIYIDYYINNTNSNNKEQFFIGISIINVSTGDIKILEIYNNDYNKLLEDLNKEFIIYNPKEVILSFDNNNKYYNELYELLKNKSKILHRYDFNSKYSLIEYQNEFFKNIFKNIFSNGNLLSPIEHLDLEKYNYARLSLIILLKFVYKHDNTIINNLNKPDILLNSKYLNLHNNALYQLNILSTTNNYKYNSLFDVINHTSTLLGRRYLKYNLSHPLIDIDEINYRYQLIEILLTKKSKKSNKKIINDEINKEIIINDHLSIFEKQLNNIIDIEKYHNKLGMNKLLPFNYGKLNVSYKSILKLIDLSKNIFKQFDYSILNNFKLYYADYLQYFNINNLESFNFNSSGNYILSTNNVEPANNFNIFNNNIIIEIDDLVLKINNQFQLLNDLTQNLSKIINNDKIEIKYTDRDGYFLYLTKNRANKLKINLDAINDNNYKDIIFSNKNQNCTYITSKYIKSLSDSIIKLNADIQSLIKIKYYEITSQLYNKYYNTINYLNYFISYIDLIKSFSKSTYLNNYSRPLIINSDTNTGNSKSFVKYSEIRHPISELLNTDYNFVTNDITIDNLESGYLLYGSNGVGKSTLMKAVGLNIILAQIGCYVSAKYMEYYPYSNIFTRIDHSDNLFKGLSSFESEILELKTILNYSDSNSLVLGDEILNSTENISAISIISASINYFLEHNISFIFASHLHQIPEYININLIGKLNISHLQMDYNPDTKSFIYTRKLFKGMPMKNYGLIVAKSLLQNNFIINNAFDIQNKIIDNNVNNNTNIILKESNFIKKSKYNSKLLMTECIICNDNNIQQSKLNILETHHILFQQHFDDNKCNINSYTHIKKNQTSNLVNLCKFHHIEVHKSNIKINGWIKTSNGKQLDYKYN